MWSKRWFGRPTWDHPTDWYPLLGLLAAASYQEPSWIQNYIDLEGANVFEFTTLDDNARGRVYEWPYGIIVVFAGTDNIDQWASYLLNFNSQKIGWGEGLVFSAGYNFFDGLREQAHTFFSSRLDKPTTILGHSLGGAYAKLGGSLLTHMGGNLKEVITFGAPRFESKSFIQTETFKCWCVGNSRDPVIYLPPKAMLDVHLVNLVKLKAIWLPKKYGKHLDILVPTLNPPIGTPGPDSEAWWKPLYREWEAGKWNSWFYGDEPEAYLGLPNLIPAVSYPYVGVDQLPGSRAPAGGWTHTHSMNYYIYLTSLMSIKLWKQKPVAMVPGQEGFRDWFPYTYYPSSPSEFPWDTPNPVLPPPATEQERVRQWVFRNYGRYAHEELLLKTLRNMKN